MHDLQCRGGRRRGFILTELIIVLTGVMFLMPAAVSCLRVLMPAVAFREEVQDEIALTQLKHILIVSGDFQTGSSLSFIYHGEPYVLRTVNRHLILSPGTQIFLSEIDSASFEDRGGIITLIYERNGKEYIRPLVCSQAGICGNLFSEHIVCSACDCIFSGIGNCSQDGNNEEPENCFPISGSRT